MSYSLNDFQELRKRLIETLKSQSGESISCRLYEAPRPNGALSLVDENGDEIQYHVAEACNISGIIISLERILSLPRSNVACEELSEVFLLTLDVLRENIRDASASDCYQATDADSNIKSWAGFIKHPKDYVFAHRCLSDIYPDLTPPAVVIDSNFLKSWNGLSYRERDARKTELANCIVSVRVPSVVELCDFFESCAAHLNRMVTPPNSV